MNANDIKNKQVNELVTEVKMFFAFSNEQFIKNKTPLKDGDKYLSIGAGGYMPKSNLNAFNTGMKKIQATFKKAMQDQKARKAHIAYELNNHEAYYTNNIESTLDALGSDFTSQEVLNVFDGRRKLTA